ncbi:hypothetical protein L1987_15669 [Smallanthus sonchifolius]|uniref:Uncharacterized protein n=1 Tax=Smallanthus sonchifolius TaxID=185202 RepID=A0ACB9J6R5_9ASTR|nr:hypothetical protein L1987_15669 [Smallanthus sonchifolius]
MVGPQRPQFVLFGSSIVQLSFSNDGWGAILADVYARKKVGGRRRQEKWRSNHRWNSGQSVTSISVSNLPKGTKAVDLKSCFGVYCKVVDAYVAAKKDKAGYYFGFVRFEGVKDKLDTGIQFSTVNLNNARLSVNPAKFNKEGKPNRAEGERTNTHPQLPRHGQSVVGGGWGGGEGMGHTGRKSYKNALLRNQTLAAMELVLPEDAGEGLSQWFGLSLIRKTMDLSILSNLLEDASDFLDNRQVWGKWFSNLEAWSGQSLALERVVWLQIHDTVGILLGEGWRLPEEIVIYWKGKSYRCWCKVDKGDWAPKWIGKPENKLSPDRSPAAHTMAQGIHSNSNVEEVGETSLHGEGNE